MRMQFKWLSFVTLLCAAMATNVAAAATPAISAGGDVSAALAADGTVHAWGSDAFGQLGLGRSFASATPTLVNGLTGVKVISAGFDHTLALMLDGTVWAWGANEYGQLGDGTTISRSTPALIPGLSGVVAIEAGFFFSHALTADGSVWRLNFTPYRFRELTGAIAISGGGNGNAASMAALKSDGTVWTWANSYGEYIEAAPSGPYRPTPVTGLAGVASIACLWDFEQGATFFAVKSDGTVWAWGSNVYGQLGDGTTVSRTTPAPLPGLTGITSVSGKSSFAHALRSDGTLYAWGVNGLGQLGDGTTVSKLSPTVVFTGVAKFSNGSGHTVALKSDGTYWAWGSNGFGQLGEATQSPPRLQPTLVSGLVGLSGVSAGAYHTVAVTRDGTVLAWGQNTKGQLGDGTVINRTVPTTIPGLSAVKAIAAGWFSMLALRDDGRVLLWGSQVYLSTPILVQGVADAIAIAAGSYGSMALRADGSVLEFADGPSAVATVTEGISGVIAISKSRDARLALKSDGTVWSWGNRNDVGQLGDGTIIARMTPAPIPNFSDVIAISAGQFHGLALKRDGSVWAWGDNSVGQLGDGTTTVRLVPTKVSGVIGVTAVSAGWFHSLALKSDGSLAVWGSFQHPSSPLGDGTSSGTLVPKSIPGISGVVGISAGWGGFGAAQSLALRRDGVVLAWGANNLGQLGDGTLATRLSPVVVVRDAGVGSIAGNDWFLDLNPAIAKSAADIITPVFKAVATPTGSNVTASVQFRAQDVGNTASVYVFALAPASLVKGAALKGGAGPDDPAYHINLKTTPSADAKDGPLACVLAQLNSAGQLTAVSASNLQAYVTGVLSAGGTAVNVLNNISAAAIQGSTFYVGYGSTGTSMINNGVNRSVASIPGTQTCQPQAPQTGWWWDATQRDRGYGIEVRGNNLYYVSFINNPSGTPSWMVASGPTALDGSLFQASLVSYANGQTLTGAYKAPAGPTSEGLITISTATATQGTLIAPAGSRSIERMAFIPNGLTTAPQNNQPESGWWWNSAEPGRGYFIEWQNGYASVTGYMYDDAGKAVWYQSMAAAPDPRVINGTWNIFGNGNPLMQVGSGINQKLTRLTDNFAPVSIRFSDGTNGVLTLPGGRNIAITRLRF